MYSMSKKILENSEKIPLLSAKGKHEKHRVILKTENNIDIVSQDENFDKCHLISKDFFGNVNGINKETSAETEVSDKLRDVAQELKTNCNGHILTHGRFSRKQENIMSEFGFVQLPRFLLEDPRWNGIKIKYRHVLFTILKKCVWKKTAHNIHGNVIYLEPGQLAVSYRQLVEWCNEDVCFKEDHVDKNLVERAVSVFLKFQIVRQHVRHQKMILTVTLPGYYEEKKNQTETACETEPRQYRDIKEESEEKRRREDVAKRSDSEYGGVGEIAAAKKSPLSNGSKRKKISKQDSEILAECCKRWGITEKCQSIWLSKFSLDYIISHLDIMEKKPSSQIENYEKWMEMALKKDYAECEKNRQANLDFIKEFKEKNGWTEMEILKQYCKFHVPDGDVIDYPYTLDPEMFQQIVKNKFNTFRGL